MYCFLSSCRHHCIFKTWDLEVTSLYLELQNPLIRPCFTFQITVKSHHSSFLYVLNILQSSGDLRFLQNYWNCYFLLFSYCFEDAKNPLQCLCYLITVYYIICSWNKSSAEVSKRYFDWDHFSVSWKLAIFTDKNQTWFHHRNSSFQITVLVLFSFQ